MFGIKKRYIVILCALGMFALQALLPPVRPFIQLPGEVYPGTVPSSPFLASLFPGWTNTFSSTLLAWAVVLIIAFVVRARSRSVDEVPTGFYNFFEMVVEAAYNFAENIAGKKVRDFFPFFMTYILVLLVSNWMGLMPGFDSIGIWEPKPEFVMHKEIKVIKGELESNYALGESSFETYVSGLEAQYGVELEFEKGAKLTDDALHHLEDEIEHAVDAENIGDLRRGLFLLRAPETTQVVDGQEVTVKPDDADYTIVPFFRPAATDLNMTLAYAIVAMVMVQYYGIKYLGARDYFSKFFPFIGKGFGAAVAKDKIKAIDPVVGLLELVSEISKVISFAFRLLGNLFAGMVLLFVMGFLFPAANLAFFGLEFFVGLIQALVFALLMLIFMVSATEHHGDHGDDDHH